MSETHALVKRAREAKGERESWWPEDDREGVKATREIEPIGDSWSRNARVARGNVCTQLRRQMFFTHTHRPLRCSFSTNTGPRAHKGPQNERRRRLCERVARTQPADICNTRKPSVSLLWSILQLARTPRQGASRLALRAWTCHRKYATAGAEMQLRTPETEIN